MIDLLPEWLEVYLCNIRISIVIHDAEFVKRIPGGANDAIVAIISGRPVKA